MLVKSCGPELAIGPSDFMKWAAFFANLGWVNISSQHILPNAAFLLCTVLVHTISRRYILHNIYGSSVEYAVYWGALETGHNNYSFYLQGLDSERS